MNCQLAAGTAAVVGMQDDQGARLLSASCRTVNSGTAIVCATTSRRLHVLRLAVQPIAAAGTSLLTLYPLLPPPPSLPYPSLQNRQSILHGLSVDVTLHRPTQAMSSLAISRRLPAA